MIHINQNMIVYTHAEHSPTRTVVSPGRPVAHLYTLLVAVRISFNRNCSCYHFRDHCFYDCFAENTSKSDRRAMGKVDRFEITYSKPDAQYVPGEVVSGVLTLVANETISARGKTGICQAGQLVYVF